MQTSNDMKATFQSITRLLLIVTRTRTFRVKAVATIAVCSSFISCASAETASRRADKPAAIAQRREQLSAGFERLERRQANPEWLRAVQIARVAWVGNVRATRHAESEYASGG